MRGLTALYCLACEREGCLANSLFVDLCRVLDTSDACPTHLDFRENYLGDAGAAAIVRTVEIMRWVRSIDLRDSGAGVKTVKALENLANEHPNLRTVDLRGEGNDVFAMSGRRLLAVLRRHQKIVFRVNYGDFPVTMAQKLRAANRHNRELQRKEEAAINAEKNALVPDVDSLRGGDRDENLFYLATHDRNGVPLYNDDSNLLNLVESLNTYMEDYLEAYQYVGRVAAQLAVDLGAAILPCIRATAVAVPPYMSKGTGRVYPADVRATVRAVDALLGGLCANPFLLEELLDKRGSMLGVYVEKLKEARGVYESLVAARLGPWPSHRERVVVGKMRPLYNRIVAGIVQKSMTDLPSMSHVEDHLREVRVEVLDRLLEGRSRVLPVLLARVQYFAYNHPRKATEWAEAYVKKEENGEDTSVEESESVEVAQNEVDGPPVDDNGDDDDMSDAIPEATLKQTKMCVGALRELRELVQDPYTSLRYAVTRPLFEALPMEIRMFLCDVALRRAASLYAPVIFVLKEKKEEEDEEKMQQHHPQQQRRYLNDCDPTTNLDDPFDIVRVFERVRCRRDLSEVLCAFEEWYRLRQVETYHVTSVSRQEILSRVMSM